MFLADIFKDIICIIWKFPQNFGKRNSFSRTERNAVVWMCLEIFDIPINKVFAEKLIHSVGRGLFEWRSEQLIEQKKLRKKFALRFSFLNYSKQLSISNFLTFFKWIFRSEVHPLVEMHADAKYKKDWTKEAYSNKRTFAPTSVGKKSTLSAEWAGGQG